MYSPFLAIVLLVGFFIWLFFIDPKNSPSTGKWDDSERTKSGRGQ
jgi:hypothetical protein